MELQSPVVHGNGRGMEVTEDREHLHHHPRMSSGETKGINKRDDIPGHTNGANTTFSE